MVDPAVLMLFLAASLLVLLMPGPSVLCAVACSLNQGRKAGLVCVMGLETGTLVHVAGASLCISAALASSTLAFDVLRYCGAAYLVHLGVRTWLERGPAASAARPTPLSLPRVFRRGALVDLLNPHTALFLLAFLPQFVPPGLGRIGQQVWMLGGAFLVLATIVASGFVLLASALAVRSRSERFARGQRGVTAVLFMGLGLSMAFADGHDHEPVFNSADRGSGVEYPGAIHQADPPCTAP